MKRRAITCVVAIGCVLAMIGIGFHSVVATSENAAQWDIIEDGEGNLHGAYSKGGNIYYVNNLFLISGWNEPVQITDTKNPSLFPKIRIFNDIIYVVWVEKSHGNNEFYYAGAEFYALTQWTQPLKGADAPNTQWGYKYDVKITEGIINIRWDDEIQRTWIADIDGDMIPDISDLEPTIYNIDNSGIELEVDTVIADNELGITVAVDYIGDDEAVPIVSATDGDFEISTGNYIDIEMDTTNEFRAMIKMTYSDVPPSLTEKYLRMYRQVGPDWVVVTDWENNEFTGINVEENYVWAYVEHFSTYTQADASSWDGDEDGLTDLTEDTEPPTDTITNLTKEDFIPNHVSGFQSTTSHLVFDIQEQNNYMAISGWLEIIPGIIPTPIQNLTLDVGGDGTIDWKATVPINGKLRIGSLKEGISEYLFDHHLNNANSSVDIPFEFHASNLIDIYIDSWITVEDVTTSNTNNDTSGDDLFDGWQDKDGNFEYNRAGQDGIIGTDDDEIPGSRWHNLDPRNKNIVGSKGNVPWNEYQEGINQVNGNLAITSTDLQFKALGHNIELTRTYNSLNSNVNGPFGYGWQFSYGEKLEFNDPFVYFISSDGAYYEFEDLGDGNYSSPPGANMDLISIESIYKLRYPDGLVKEFNNGGNLLSISDKNGNSLSMTYDSNYRLIKVEDDSGLYLNFYYTYNRVTQIEDPAGRTNKYLYDSGNLIERHDAMGNKYLYIYHDTFALSHKMVRQINPLGLLKHYYYTSDYTPKVFRMVVGEYNFTTGQSTPYFTEFEAEYSYPGHTSAKDANNHSTKRIFDEKGVATKTINPDGTTTSVIYNKDLKPEEDTDSRGNLWQNKFDAMGNQIEGIDPLGNRTSTIYKTEDTSDKFVSMPEKMTNKNGEIVSLELDTNYNSINITDQENYITNYEYTPEGFLSSQTKSNGAVTTYEYDVYGNVIYEIDPMGNIVTLSYNEINQKISEVDPRGYITQFTYDNLGRKISVIDSLDNIETFTYDAIGNLLSYTDKAGFTTTYEYDIFNRKITDIDALGNSTHYEYDQVGNLITEIDKRGAITSYYYDEMNRMIEVIDALGNSEYYNYDEAGNKIQTIDKLGNYWNTTFDALGRVIEEYCPYDKAIKYEYDAEGQLVKTIDRMGYETVYEYDARGQKVRELRAEGSDTRGYYDSVGNLESVSQIDGANTSTWEYEYDILGRKIGDYSPLEFESTWTYDEVGNVIEYYDAYGSSTTYTYDALNRLTNLTLPGDVQINITYQITENERQGYDYPPKYQIYVWPPRPSLPTPPRLSVLDKEFDMLGRLISETWAFLEEDNSTTDYAISYEYDEIGNVISMTDQLGNITTYTYDDLNRLETLTDPDDDTTSYIYDNMGQLVETIYPTGTRIYQEYNKANLLTKIENVKSTNEIISSFAYEYNFNGNRISVTEADGSTIYYDYDGENRITAVEYPDGSEIQYQYDNRNNLETKTYLSDGIVMNVTDFQYDIENRLISAGDVNYTYDNNGNMIEGNTRYGYLSTYLNGQKVNVLASVGTVGGGGPITFNTNPPVTQDDDTPATTYGYALDGRRIGKAGAVNVKFLYDGDNVVYELWNDKIVRFTHPISSSSGCQQCGKSSSIFFVDHPISITIDGQKYYYLYDGLGSVTELIDEDENVVNRYRYTPFGSPLIKDETVYNPYQFTGRRFDNESGMYYYRARMYSPQQHRFMQLDPEGMVDGTNMYVYVNSNPINEVDPCGTYMVCAAWYHWFSVDMICWPDVFSKPYRCFEVNWIFLGGWWWANWSQKSASWCRSKYSSWGVGPL